MRTPRLVVFALVAVLAIVAPACGNTLVRSSAATVNGHDISQSALDEELSAIQSNALYVDFLQQQGAQLRGSGRGTLSNSFVGRVLTLQIFVQLIEEELDRRDLTVTPADIQAAEATAVQSTGGQEIYEAFPESYRQTLRRRYATVAKLQGVLGGPPADAAAVQRFYEENPALFAQTCVSHILFAVVGPDGQIDQAATASESDRLRAQAEAVRAEIAAGADFGALAAQHSVDTGSKDNGGSLECGPPGRFVPEFETAMDALGENEVSAPVQTQFGFHLIKVTGRPPQSLEEATPLIRQRLESESQEGISTFLQQAVGEARISVNPRYGRWTKDGPAPGVVPPDAPTTTEVGGPRSPEEQVPNPLAP